MAANPDKKVKIVTSKKDGRASPLDYKT